MSSTVVDTAVAAGRHRFGIPGLVHVRTFAAVHERSLIARLLGLGRSWGKHHVEARDISRTATDRATRLITAPVG